MNIKAKMETILLPSFDVTHEKKSIVSGKIHILDVPHNVTTSERIEVMETKKM